jgi:hypothetical protein
VLECLPSKFVALSLNPSITKKEKRETKQNPVSCLLLTSYFPLPPSVALLPYVNNSNPESLGVFPHARKGQGGARSAPLSTRDGRWYLQCNNTTGRWGSDDHSKLPGILLTNNLVHHVEPLEKF